MKVRVALCKLAAEIPIVATADFRVDISRIPWAEFRPADPWQAATTQRFDLQNSTVKNFQQRMLRQGKVSITQHKTGRGGSTYCREIPQAVLEESHVSSPPPQGGETEHPT